MPEEKQKPDKQKPPIEWPKPKDLQSEKQKQPEKSAEKPKPEDLQLLEWS